MDSINIYAVIISWKPNKEGMVPLAIRFDYNSQRVGHEKLNHKIRPGDWDGATRQVKASCANHRLINQLITSRLAKHRDFFLKRETFNLPVSRDLVKQYIDSGRSTELFSEFARHMLDTRKLKNGNSYAEDSRRRYQDEINRLEEFRPALAFHQITPAMLSDYKQYLLHTYKKKDGTALERNSIWKALSFLRSTYNYAIKKEVILPENNPFKNFDVGSFETNTEKIKYLELHEVEDLERVLMEKQHLLQAMTLAIGWRFLTMCVIGMRISDAMNLDQSSFNDAGDLEYIPYKTRTHGNVALVPVTADRQKRYLQTTLQHKLPACDHKTFRTTFNNHLKILAALAGITINLTSHVGRHTMGSFLVDGNVEEPAAKAILGIKSGKTIKTYAHLKQSKLKIEANKLKGVM